MKKTHTQAISKESAKDSFFRKMMAEFRATGLYSELFLKDLEIGLRDSDYYEAYTRGELRHLKL